ncbi:hypothetical protein HGA13_01585 [Nocardia speluncae]|uniref:Uncharacterized protein n=1 Tax=Nocardia speluncae TaxID=419477 RepID=A0A846X9R4_9NOCA|nr:hypothetical protein [Nocardia speluncae]NKY31769.1 hypothetical protein [Nocardia speluncae]
MSPPLDPTITEALRAGPVGQTMDKPIDQVLRDMGLPPLPEIPALPEFPLPVLDLTALARPLTDLASSFGTGQFPAAPDVDPIQVLSQVSSVVQTAVQVGSSALQMASGLWQGQAAAAAAAKQAQVSADSTAVATQSTQTSLGVAAAAGSVSRGGLTLAAIIAKYLTTVTMAAPFLATGAGQVFLTATTVETMLEALAVVAQTRAELTVHSAEMTATGTKIPVTDPPNADAMQILSQVMQVLPTVVNAATTGARALAENNTALHSRTPADTALTQTASGVKPHDIPEGGGPGGGAPMMRGGGSPAPAARPLAPWSGAPAAGNTGSSPASTASTSTTASSPAGSQSPGRGTGPAFMPGGGAGGAMARGGAESTTGNLQGALVTEQHGSEMVGDIDDATPPVIGVTERITGTAPDGPPPDKALTL